MFGLSPFGLSPFGLSYGTVPVLDGASQAARFAHLNFGDYVLDLEGNLIEAPDLVDAEAAWRLDTLVGSFIGDRSIGSGLMNMRVLTSRSLVEIRDVITRTLDPMISRGAIKALAITPDPRAVGGVAHGYYYVTYTKTGLVE